MAQREIQSVEVSCFVHSTEDPAKVEGAIRKALQIEDEPSVEQLEGHFGNSIVHTSWHLVGDGAWNAFGALVRAIGEEGRQRVLKELEAETDEHGALYMRINKQSLMRGKAEFSSSDPIRVRIKPRKFMMKGSPEQFYARLMEATSR